MNKMLMLTNLTPLILRHCRRDNLTRDVGLFVIGVIVGALLVNRQGQCYPQRPTIVAVANGKTQTADSGSVKEN